MRRPTCADPGGSVVEPEALALAVAGRRGMKRAKVALARKLASVLHRMWLDGTGFRFGKEVAAA